MDSQYQRVYPGRRGWISTIIKPASLFGFILLGTALVVGIVILAILSSSRSGFVAVNGDHFSAIGYQWNLSILWTTLPNFIFQLTGLYWNAIVAAFVDRQPYVELSKSHKKGGARLKKSVMLDYRTDWVLWRWFVAFKNRHILIGVSILLGLILSAFVGPFSASLLVPKSDTRESATTILAVSDYDEKGLNSSTDWKPVFDRVATTTLYNGEPYPWTNSEFAFRAFSEPGQVKSAPLSSNISTDTDGISAYLDCEEITDYQSSLDSTDSGEGQFSIKATDRGCDVSQEFKVSANSQIYLKTTSERSCSLQAYQSRLVFTAGQYSSSASKLLNNVTFISCVTGYSTTPGRLTFNLASNSTGLSFKKMGDPKIGKHIYWNVIESNMFLSTAFSLNSQWAASDFGSIVLYRSSQKQPSSYLSPNFLIDSISTVFTSTYLTATAMNAFNAKTIPDVVPATLAQSQTRLFVVTWVAVVNILGLVFCMLCCSLIWYSVQNNSTILAEEPTGLLSAAGLLHGSNLLEELVDDACTSGGYDGSLVKILEQKYDLNRGLCTAQRKEGHSHPVINLVSVSTREDFAAKSRQEYQLDQI